MEENYLILTTNVLRNDDLDGTLHFYKSFVNYLYSKTGIQQQKINFDFRNPAFKFQKEIIAKVNPDSKLVARKFFENCSNFEVIIALHDSSGNVEIEISFYDKAENSWQVESFEDLADDSWLEEKEIQYVKRKMKKFFDAYVDEEFDIDDLQDIYLTR